MHLSTTNLSFCGSDQPVYTTLSFRPISPSPPVLAVAKLSFLTTGTPILPFQADITIFTEYLYPWRGCQYGGFLAPGLVQTADCISIVWSNKDLRDVEISDSGHVCHSALPVHVADSGTTSTGSGCTITSLAGMIDVHDSYVFLSDQSSFRIFKPHRLAKKNW